MDDYIMNVFVIICFKNQNKTPKETVKLNKWVKEIYIFWTIPSTSHLN
jgi:hypothetical protein